MATNGRANGHANDAGGRPDRARLAADLRARLKHSEIVDERSELQTYGYDASFLTQLNPSPPDLSVFARSAEDARCSAPPALQNGVRHPVTIASSLPWSRRAISPFSSRSRLRPQTAAR